MLLNEAYENLNSVDNSLIRTIISNIGESEELRRVISPNSEVKIDKLPGEQHSFKYLINDYISQPNVAFVVIRVHGRQWCLISDKYPITREQNSLLLEFTSFAMDFNDELPTNVVANKDNPVRILRNVSNSIKAFYEGREGVRPQWDILVVHTDPSNSDKIDNRKEISKDKVEIPQDGSYKYNNFINSLKKNFTQRSKEFIEKNRLNTTNKEELVNYLTTAGNLNMFKFNNEIFRMNDYDRDWSNGKWILTYMYKNDSGNSRILLKLELKNLTPKIIELTLTTDNNTINIV